MGFIMEELKKPKSWFILTIPTIIFLIVIILSWGRITDRFAIRELTGEIKKEFGQTFKFEEVELDKEKKEIKIAYEINQTCTPNVFNEFREFINDFLASNPKYFLNEDYRINF